MNILLVSECRKNALVQTRRILDQFAERCGERTWQTPITKQGLETLHKLLRHSARKNTAVACYWTHGKNDTELLWIVGNRLCFNEQGRVPTNRSRRNILKAVEEGGWRYARSLQILSVLAALLHDLGKSSLGFQKKLRGELGHLKGDPFRHEWVSLRIFQALVKGAENDADWLNRLADFAKFEQDHPDWQAEIYQDGMDIKTVASDYALAGLPPLAQALGWLMVSHHRMPFYEATVSEDTSIEVAFNKELAPAAGWVKNIYPDQKVSRSDIQLFWTFEHMVTESVRWRKAVAKWARHALEDEISRQSDFRFFDPFLMYLARSSLMVGDHTYSSQDRNEKRGDKNYPLYANTRMGTDDRWEMKQTLDEHLLGVMDISKNFSYLLPRLPHLLPRIIEHKRFKRRTKNPRFFWQNDAYELACSMQEPSEKYGFFGINMASTGCGKTLGNGRIMYGLSDPEKGARFTIALGLRVLTLQTGQVYREEMHLDESALAVLVGGQAVIDLFNLNAQSKDQSELEPLKESEQQKHEQSLSGQTEKILAEKGEAGSESILEFEQDYVQFDSPIEDRHLGRLLRDQKSRQLLFAPIVSCTIDHLVGATETSRGGRFIVPLLRLLTADLILDEPDDFNLEDLPALSRLVNIAGMMGSRVLLSSATLPPDLLAGLFEAYQAGRKIWNHHQGIAADAPVVCAWFDEQNSMQANSHDLNEFSQAHQAFIQKRVQLLAQAPVQRIAAILELKTLPPERFKKLDYSALAADILSGVQALHQDHHSLCPATRKKVSFGLVRISNIAPLIELALALYQHEGLADTEIHLCTYHARQIFALRSDLEQQLDTILNRKNPEQIFQHPKVQPVLQNSKAKNVIFIVLATPVAEVGRDHDYDWAIIEPSSMRSIIQLSGRIRRHRPEAVRTRNILILGTNIRSLKSSKSYGVNTACFTRPGFEFKKNDRTKKPLIRENFLLSSHLAKNLLAESELKISAIPRIHRNESLNHANSITDLEHAVVAYVMNQTRANSVNSWYRPVGNHYPANPYLFHLQKYTPFRKSRAKICYQYLPEEDQYKFVNRETERDEGNIFLYAENISGSGSVSPWLNADYETVLTQLCEELDETDVMKVARKFGFVDLTDERAWYFHPLLGFWVRK